MKSLVPKVPRSVKTLFKWGNVKQIMATIMQVVNNDATKEQVKELAAYIENLHPQRPHRQLEEVWRIVREHIKYIEDPHGLQDIKLPARTWEDSYGDCKSMTVLAYFIVRCLMPDAQQRIVFASYVKSKEIGHVYNAVYLDGQEIIIDAVYHEFNAEEEYTERIEKTPAVMAEIRVISGLAGSGIGAKSAAKPKRKNFPISRLTDGQLLAQLKARELDLVAHINDKRGFTAEADESKRLRDIMLTVGDGVLIAPQTYNLRNENARDVQQLLRKLERRDFAANEGYKADAQRIAGPYDVRDEQRAACHSLSMQTTYGPQGPTGYQFNQSYYENCLEVKYMENLVNAHLDKAGSTFVYSLMPEDNAHFTIITVKQLNQAEWIHAIASVTGLSVSAVEGFCRNGVVNDMEDTPEGLRALFYPAMTGNANASIGFIDPVTLGLIISGIAAIVTAVTKAISDGQKLKSEAEKRKENAFNALEGRPLDSALVRVLDSDFYTDFDTSGGGSGNNGGSNGSGGSNNENGGSGLLIPAVLAATAGYFLTR